MTPKRSELITSLADAKRERANRQYRDLVMQAFDDMEHEDKREKLESKAAVEHAARQRL